MIVAITPQTKNQIKNPALAQYAQMYLNIYDQYMAQIEATGITLDHTDYSAAIAERYARLRAGGAHFRNGDRSIYLNAISPACVACKTGVGSVTFFISLQCHRSCYYCFNPNQCDYDFFQTNARDLVSELDTLKAQGQKLSCVALTGGEPLLHKPEAVAFFARAREHYPDAHRRLYTCGDYADDETLAALRDAGLDEIRFSIRMHDNAAAKRLILDRIAAAQDMIPKVMVELPIPPDSLDEMKGILSELDRIGIHSINLLELCYPLMNPDDFNARGFQVKARPFETLYDYWYAGGMPIARSEIVCLDLMAYALDEGMTMGVHYCSLENKFTGQNYMQNAGKNLPKTVTLSSYDYLLKSAKVFGEDITPVLAQFERSNYRDYELDAEHQYLEFNINQIRRLKGLDVEIGISTSTLEDRGDGTYLRELKVDLTTPDMFKPADI